MMKTKAPLLLWSVMTLLVALALPVVVVEAKSIHAQLHGLSGSSSSRSDSDDEVTIIDEVHYIPIEGEEEGASSGTAAAATANTRGRGRARTSAINGMLHHEDSNEEEKAIEKARRTVPPENLESWRKAVQNGQLDLSSWDSNLRNHALHGELSAATTLAKEEEAKEELKKLVEDSEEETIIDQVHYIDSREEGEEPTTPTPAPHLFQHIDKVMGSSSSSSEEDGPTPSAPVPDVPVPTLPPSNRTTTPQPSVSPTTPTTPRPSSITPSPTTHPTKQYHPPFASEVPTVEPTTQAAAVGSNGISFFRMMGKMIAWCILLALAILLYGFCLQHKYQIAYYARHAAYYLNACVGWIIQKVNGGDQSHNLHNRYAAMYASERNDALAQSLFDGTSYDNNNSPTTAGGAGTNGFGFGSGSGGSSSSGGMMSMMFQSSGGPSVPTNYDTSNGFIMSSGGGGGQQNQPQPQQQQQNW